MKIEIKTRLDKGIYPSQGGGHVTTHYEYNVGTRNLIKAMTMLKEHRSSMIRSYGNVGHIASWITIGDKNITLFDLWDYDSCDDPELDGHITKTEWAKNILAE